MAPGEKPPRQPAVAPRAAVVKRPWQPPRVRTGHLFESNSLACGKSTPNTEQCIQNPVMS